MSQPPTDPPRPPQSWDTIAPTERDPAIDQTASFTEAVDPAPGTDVVGGDRYRAVRLHARGGLGEVFVAIDRELRRQVALKEIQDRHAADAVSRERFVREAEITGRLEHPGIVPVYGLGRYPDGRPFYAMRFIKGETLRDAIRDYHAMPPGPGRRLAFRELLQRFVAVCNAVAFAHSQGVVHRDLKPNNVMLGGYGETLVVDWGLAKYVSHDDPGGEPSGEPVSGDSDMTAAGSVMGTPAFMSPEQAEGRTADTGPSADVYSLGATLYELLTDRPPVNEGDLAEVIAAVREGRFPPPRRVNADVPRALEAVCLKAMALKPADRYAGAAELARDVERWLADEPVSAYREPWPTRVARWGRRHRTLVAAAGVLLVTAVAGLTIGLVVVGREQARTDRARQEARDNFRRSRDVVNRLLVQFADSPEGLRGVPGMAEVRRRMLEEAMAYYQTFLDEQSDDPDVRHEAARAFLLTGQVRRDAGADGEAEPALLRSRELLTGLVGQFPDSSEYRLDLARCHTRLGWLYQALKRFPEATAEYRAAADECERLVAAAPDDPRPRHQLVLARLNLGVALRESGDGAGAETAYRAAEAAAKALPAGAGAPAEYRGALAHVRNNLGNLYAERGLWKEALAELDAAVDVWGRLNGEFPKLPEFRAALASATGNRINPLSQLGRKGETLEAADRALELRRRLSADFPTSPDYKAGLAQSYYNRGIVLRDMGRAAEAESPLRESADQYRALAREFDHLPAYRNDLIRSVSVLAQLRDGLKRTGEAEANHREALAESRRLSVDHGDVRSYRSERANNANNLGNMRFRQDGLPEAEELLGEAIDIWRGLAEEVPGEPAYHADLGMALGNLSNVLRRRNDSAGARRVLEEAVASHDRALALTSDNSKFREGADRELTKLIAVLMKELGDYAAAGALADKWAGLNPTPKGQGLYLAASLMTMCMQAAEKDASLPEARRQELARGYQRRALNYLRRLKALGDSPAMLRALIGPDTAPLRQKVDLKKELDGPPVDESGG
jgi:serine/threonine-protein kinase